MEPTLAHNLQWRLPELLAVEVVVTVGLFLWLVSNAVLHLIDYWRARQAVREYISAQPAGGEADVPTSLELRRAAFPPLLSVVLVLNVLLQLVVAVPFALAAIDFVGGQALSGARWAKYAFAAFAGLWCLFLIADPWVHWVPRNALERHRSLLVAVGIVGFALFSFGG